MLSDFEQFRFSHNHLWIKMSDDFTAVCGITAQAVERIGTILFVNLPEMRWEIKKGDRIGYCESVKRIFEIFSPLTGEIIEVNSALGAEPNLINSDPLNSGWIMKIDVKYRIELEDLLDENDYYMLDFFSL